MELQERFARALSAGDSVLRDRALAPLIQASPLLFAQLCLKGPEMAPFNGRLLFSPFHYQWEKIIVSKLRFVIKAGRATGKSYIGTIVHSLWRLATQPGIQIYIFSGTEFGAQRMLEEIKLEIENNPKLRWLYPDSQGRKWTATQIRTSNGGHLVAKGMLTRVRGAHPDVVIADDILTDEDGWSAAKRAKTEDYFYSTMTNMLLPHGQLACLGTPQSAQDLIANLEANDAYFSGTYPALDNNNKSTWSEVYSDVYLLDLEKEIGTVRFARERRCMPVSEESSLFPRSMFMQGDIMQPHALLGAPEQSWRTLGIHSFYIGVDFAFSASTSADYFIVFVLGVDQNGNRWVVDIDRRRGISFSEQKNRIVSMGRKYPCVVMHLESNQAQRIAADELKRSTDLPIKHFVTTAEKHSLTHGLPAIRMLLENQKFRIPRGDQRSVELTDVFIDEASNFTWQDGKAMSVGNHDDTVMACLGPGAMIMVPGGAVPVEDIVPGDVVIGGSGNACRVIKVSSRRSSGAAFRVARSGMPAFIITAEHPILICGEKNSHPAKKEPSFSWKFVPAQDVVGEKTKKTIFVRTPRAAYQKRMTRCDIIDLANFLPTFSGLRNAAKWTIGPQTLNFHSRKEIPRFINCDEDFGYFLGIYFAQGSTSGNRHYPDENGAMKCRHKTVDICLHEDYADCVDWMEHLVRNITGRTSSRSKRVGRFITTHFSCMPVALMFQSYGKSKNKRIPDSWMTWPLPVLKSLLLGWLMGDGYVDGKTGQIGGSSRSRVLIYQMWFIWQCLGYVPRIFSQNIEGRANQAKGSRYYTLSLSMEETRNFVETCDWKKWEKRRWAAAGHRKAKRAAEFVTRAGAACYLRSCDVIKYQGNVYNLQVETDESYVVEGVTVHNCYIADRGIARGSRVIVADAKNESIKRNVPTERNRALVQHLAEQHQSHAASPRAIVSSPESAQAASGQLVCRNGVYVRA